MKKMILKKWIGISLVLSMLISTVIPVSGASVTPEWEKILKSIAVTNHSLEKDYEDNKPQALKLIEGIIEKPYELNMNGEFVNIKGKNISSTNAELLKGCGMQLSQKSNIAANTYLMQGNLNKNKDIIMSGALFISNQLMAVNSKELLGDTYLGINPSTLNEDMKASIWAKEFEEAIAQGMDIKALINAQNPKLKQEQLIALTAKYKVIGKDTIISNDAKKTGAVTLELKNGKVSCDEYTITLKKEWIHSYIDQLGTTFKNDKALQDWMLQQPGEKALSEFSAELKKEITAGTDEFVKGFKSVVSQDVLVKIYINEKDEIIKAACETRITNESDKKDYVDIKGEMILGDGKSLAEGVTASIKGTQGEIVYGSINYDMNKTKINNEDSIVSEFKVIADNKDMMTMTTKANYDQTKTQDNMDFTFVLKGEGFNIGASAKGDLEVLTNSAAVKAIFDEVKLTMAVDQENLELQLKGNISLSQIDAKDININTSNVKMIMKMSQKELEALSTQVTENGYLLMNKMEKLFKSESKYQAK